MRKSAVPIVFTIIFLLIYLFSFLDRAFPDNTYRSTQTYVSPTSTPRPVSTSTATPQPTDTPAPTFDYSFIAHAKSKIFHNPLCPTAQIISDSNREYFTCSRDALINAGYQPCPSCHGEAYTAARIQATAVPFPTSAPRPTATPNEAWARFLAAIAAPSKTARPTARPPATSKPAVTYIANTSTGKFHKPSCASVSQMYRTNRKEFYCTRQEMISMGYSPCQRCHP